jgi:hypothetical protein
MIGSLRAFVWLRWRLLANSLRGGRRRDTLEQISRAVSLMMPAILGVLSLGLVVATTVVGFVGGRAAANGVIDAPLAVFVLRVSLALMVSVLVIFAVVMPSQATLTRYTRLLLLPISRRSLHVVETAASLSDPWLLWIVPGLFAIGIGIFAGGRPMAAALATLAAVVLIATLAALNTLLGFLVSLIVRNRRRSEIFTLVFVIGISAASFLPALFAGDLEERSKGERRRRDRPEFSVERVDAALPWWTRALPPEIYARTVLAGLRSDGAGAVVGVAALAAELAALFAASAMVHARLLGTPEGRGRRSRRDATDVAVLALPLLGPRPSAIAWSTFKTTLRSVRGRLMVILGGPLVAVLLLVLTTAEPDEAWPAFLMAHGYLAVGVGGIFGIYSLQAISMNFFGSERSGLTLQFLLPFTDAEIARGKVAGGLLALSPALALTVVAVAAVAPTGSPWYWLAAFMGVVATYLWMSPFFVWLSALFPVPADLSKTGSGGNPHALPMFAGTFLALLVAAPAAGILAAGAFWLRQPLVTFLLMSGWLILAAAVAHVLVVLTAGAITMRRENLALVAQGK